MHRNSYAIPLALTVALSLLCTASPGIAQKATLSAKADEKGGPSAKDLYAAAQKLFDKGSYSEALVAFRQAYNASNSPNARLMVGHCLVALGKTAEAYDEMAATMREAAKRAETEPKYAPTRDSAATQLAQLEAKVGKVILDVPDPSATEVMLNGARLETNVLGTPIAVLPGAVVVVATNSDGRRARSERNVKAGETERIALQFIDAQAVPKGPFSGATNDPSKKEVPDTNKTEGLKASTGGGVRVAGFVVFGLGAASIAAFGITGSMAKGRFSTVEDECGGVRCTDPKYADVIDSGKMLSTVANISLVAGAVGILGGSLMIALGGPTNSSKPALAFTIKPGALGVLYTGVF